MKKQITISILIAIFVLMMLIMIFGKPPLKTVSEIELDAVYGLKEGGVMMGRVVEFISNNPEATVEDLRIIKGVDDMIIDQLKRHYK